MSLSDGLIAARLCANDFGLGGMVLRGGEGGRREAVLAALRAALPERAPWKRLPVNADDEAIDGGLDLGAALGRGEAVRRKGLISGAQGGVIVVPMAERLSATVAARLGASLDSGGVIVVALDDGRGEETVPGALIERLAFRVELEGVETEEEEGQSFDKLRTSGEIFDLIAATAGSFGIDSARAMNFTVRAAHALEEDVVTAARLVLGPRAMRVPEEASPPPPEENKPPEAGESEANGEGGTLEDVVLAAVLASLPPDLLARIAAGKTRGTAKGNGAGERKRSGVRGRPLSARAGLPKGGARLALIDTLRAAAPWQRLRREAGERRVHVRRDDLRVRRFEARAQAVTVFAVDASGSSALARLAEAKGAVELLLAEAYVKRAQVALIAFRGDGAELLLPPTRSLTRARRALAELPGGGGTPLAAGLNAAREVAMGGKARGQTPFLVVLTDGRANVALSGGSAQGDAEAAAKAIGAEGLSSAFIDISARPRAEGAKLAELMGAHYLALPRADARALHAAVKAAQG